jgi:hypothetical protein
MDEGQGEGEEMTRVGIVAAEGRSREREETNIAFVISRLVWTRWAMDTSASSSSGSSASEDMESIVVIDELPFEIVEPIDPSVVVTDDVE